MRKKLFVPSPELSRKIDTSSENVLALLQEIDYHGLMRTYHIFESFPTRNQSNLYTQLNRLFHHEYVGRDSEFDYRKHRYEGSLPFFYWLRSKGKYVLSKHDKHYTGHVDYEPKSPKLQNLEHDLTTTTFMVKVKMYCLRHNVRFISHYEILDTAPRDAQLKDDPFKFKVKTFYVDQQAELWIEPDKVFGIERADGRKAYFFLETDMGQEPQRRASHYTSSIYKKIVAYRAVQNTSIHKTQLNLPNFRVLFITSKNSLRAKNLMQTSQEGGASSMYLFGVLQDITNPFDYFWTTGKEGHIKLLP